MILVCLLGEHFYQHEYYFDISKNNFVTITIALLIYGFWLWLLYKIVNKKHKYHKWLVIISILLFGVQLLFVALYYFRTGWDVNVVITAAEDLSSGNSLGERYITYFSHYPNNVFLMMIFAKIFSFANLIGLGSRAYALLLFILVTLNTITGYLLFKVVYKISNNLFITWSSYSLYFLTVWLSPWVSIPYSDSLGIVLPILILYIYLNLEKFLYFKLGLLGFLAIVGLNIKPQIAIIFIAVMIVELLFNKVGYQLKLLRISSIVIGMIISSFFIGHINRPVLTQLDKEQEVSYFHFMKMGLNEVTSGAYFYDDVEASFSQPTKALRNQENISTIKSRLKTYGIKGLIHHINKKTLINFNNGTFGWAQEGSFYRGAFERNNPLSTNLKSFYYTDGSNHMWFKYIAQGSWLIILVLLCGNIFRRKITDDPYQTLVFLALIGLFTFETLFEARSRYLYTYIPIYIVGHHMG